MVVLYLAPIPIADIADEPLYGAHGLQRARGLCGTCALKGLIPDAAAHRRLVRRPRVMASLMRLLDGRDWLRSRALRALASSPEAFGHLAALHVGQLSLASGGWCALRACGWTCFTG